MEHLTDHGDYDVRLAGGHLYGKQLFTWLSLVVSLMASFVLSCFPLDVLDEIWDLIESVSEGFLIYSYQHSEDLIRRQIQSRHKSQTKYNVWIRFFIASSLQCFHETKD